MKYLLLLLVLGYSTVETAWVMPKGKTQADLNLDKYNCEVTAMMAYPSNARNEGRIAEGIRLAAPRQELEDKCMQVRGYSKVVTKR